LRDWLISRQRYWGAPIPVIYDPEGEPHLVKDKDLPWLLPEDVDFKPTGESPLVSSQELQQRTQEYAVREFAELIAQKGWSADGAGWRPEYDTMDTFVDSSWYYLRYLDARNQDLFARGKRLNQFMPVDFYLIGPEHIVLHLLYSRFFTKFLRDQSYIDLPSGEPFTKMRHQGMILGPDHKKMSKSKGNVINPDVIIKKYGADTLRVYEMFMGPLEADKPWDDRAVQGVARFLNKIYKLFVLTLEGTSSKQQSDEQLQRKLHATLKKMTQDLPALKFNTAIAALMEFSNDWQVATSKNKSALSQDELRIIAKMIAPLAPFLAEELWSLVGEKFSVHQQSWPEFDPELAAAQTIVIPVQVNGKLRGELELDADKLEQMSADEIITKAKQLDSVQKWLVDQNGKPLSQLKKEIYVPDKIVSLVG
ncbi:MAG: Leucine--tRNA ligase, partial [Microgenomates bacterium 39_7]